METQTLGTLKTYPLGRVAFNQMFEVTWEWLMLKSQTFVWEWLWLNLNTKQVRHFLGEWEQTAWKWEYVLKTNEHFRIFSLKFWVPKENFSIYLASLRVNLRANPGAKAPTRTT